MHARGAAPPAYAPPGGLSAREHIVELLDCLDGLFRLERKPRAEGCGPAGVVRLRLSFGPSGGVNRNVGQKRLVRSHS
jgi:hypothetical protein